MDWYASDDNLCGTPGSWKKLNAGRLPTCGLWTVDANSHMPCHSVPIPRCAVALRSLFQNRMVIWHGTGAVWCVNQTQPHCVNQMGKTQFKPLAAWERHCMCELAWSFPYLNLPSEVLCVFLSTWSRLCRRILIWNLRALGSVCRIVSLPLNCCPHVRSCYFVSFF
jgi:hypothetical protein